MRLPLHLWCKTQYRIKQTPLQTEAVASLFADDVIACRQPAHACSPRAHCTSYRPQRASVPMRGVPMFPQYICWPSEQQYCQAAPCSAATCRSPLKRVSRDRASILGFQFCLAICTSQASQARIQILPYDLQQDFRQLAVGRDRRTAHTTGLHASNSTPHPDRSHA